MFLCSSSRREGHRVLPGIATLCQFAPGAQGGPGRRAGRGGHGQQDGRGVASAALRAPYMVMPLRSLG
jgi:hypothetical protein